ncbi:oligosaccharide flippase family protein [Methanobacterium alkalithermotolerans]|uniref:Oligosaccharide flippase family protein n=1 Tax=Methanobacterium alkalithermotolerans TaxID=2731220 RepID=A0A8T8K2A9_9EURY|nr:oligosaccharide flippase family protein [Methanobacterium alkalithermotolerans]QUH22626.1 oligosaccharide flippase family protein [Methanobacterium alkalithermotolerans]
MNDHIKFSSDVFWVGLSQIVIYALAFFTLPALTKSFGSELYGLWSQIVVTVGLLTPILTLHLSTATVRYLASESDKYELSKSFINMLALIFLIILFVVLFSVLFRDFLAVLLFGSAQFSFFILLTFVWAGLETIFTFLLSYFRARGKIKRLSLINILFSILKVSSLVILASMGFSLEFLIMVIIFIELFLVILIFYLIMKDVGFNWPDFKGLRKYLNFSIPQIPSGALLWIIDSSDRYFITAFLGLSQTGIYSASYSIGSLISMFYIPLSFVIFPILSNFWENNDIENVKNYLEYPTKLFLALAVPAAGGLFVLSKPLLLVLTTSEFAVGGLLTFLVALGTIFLGLYQINLYIVYLIEKTKFIPFFIGFSTLFNIVLNIVLIPSIGIMGAAISTIVSYMILALVVMIWAKRRIDYNFDIIFIIKVIISSIFMMFVLNLFYVNSLFSIFLVAVLGFLVYCGFLLLFNPFKKKEKKIIIELIAGFKN